MRAGGEGDDKQRDGITDLMDMNLSKLQEMVKDREIWRVAVYWVTKSWTQLNNSNNSKRMGPRLAPGSSGPRHFTLERRMGWGWPHGRVDRRHPFPSQPAAGRPVGRRAGVQRAGSCDHKPGIFLATRFGKGQPDCLLRLQREGVSSAQRNSCLVPLVYSQTRQTLEQEGVS